MGALQSYFKRSREHFGPHPLQQGFLSTQAAFKALQGFSTGNITDSGYSGERKDFFTNSDLFLGGQFLIKINGYLHPLTPVFCGAFQIHENKKKQRDNQQRQRDRTNCYDINKNVLTNIGYRPRDIEPCSAAKTITCERRTFKKLDRLRLFLFPLVQRFPLYLT